LGDYNRARYDLNTAILYNRDLPLAYAYRGLLNFKVEDEESAIDDFTQALTLDPNMVDALRNRGVAYNKLGEKEKSIDDLKKYLEIARDAPDAGEVRQMLAELERAQS
jgi:tetratricopeptide (TPR) repeat protein